ncbi:MAG: calcium/sodium antiporter [Calditrichaeota bacterium]|nr:MAG: calcium/sodium antiporter [Calditrichota bacterium]
MFPLQALLLLIVGFALLIKGADWLVEGASSLAMRMRIRQIVIGLTVVAFGTSTPELVVNILAALKGNVDIAFGNIMGSNIANILLILGLAAAIQPIHTHHNTIWREIPFSLLAVFVLFALVNDRIFTGEVNLLARNDALILLLFFLIFLAYNFAIAKIEIDDLPEVKMLPVGKIILFISTGLGGLFFGGRLVVDNAVIIARYFQISEKVIGLTIVAVGTSLPELFTSMVAAAKNKMDIAVGNVVGSNIFNVFFILGVTGLIHPLDYNSSMNFDFIVLAIASILLFISTFIHPIGKVSRVEGICFVIIYFIYLVYVLTNG